MLIMLANLILPLFIFSIILYGRLRKQEMYEPFVQGVQKGFHTVLHIAPTLIALFFAIGIFRSSGALELLVNLLAPLGAWLHIPKQVLPIIFTKLCSSSAATGFLLDLYKTHGPDSLPGLMASIILCSTETCLYVLSVYCSSIGVTTTRYILAGALLSITSGVAASVLCTYWFF